MPSIITFMGKAQIRWAGHVTLMPDERIPKQLLYGELCQGKRSVSGQRKRFEDSLKVSLIDFSIDTQTWENLAADRPTWRSFIHSGAYVAEDNRTDAVGKKRETRQSRNQPANHPNSHVSNLWERVSLSDWSHQPPPDTPSQLHEKLRMSWSSSTPKDEQQQQQQQV